MTDAPDSLSSLPLNQLDPIEAASEAVIAHMNDDHADAMPLYCRAFSKATEITGATMTDVDRSGFEMSAVTKEGPRPVRLAFPDPVATPEQVRTVLVAMLKTARAKLP